jgi:Cu-Zn family superoxide dismutase
MTRPIIAILSAAVLCITGCKTERQPPSGKETAGAKALAARAVIEPRSKSSLKGEARFTEVEGGVKVEVQVTGVTPGPHAIHIHEKGDCSAADASSAGDHFNPDVHPHGAPTAEKHHAGDFGNMEVGADGNGKLELVSKVLTIKEGTHSVVGRSIIIHEKADDMTTQPTGNAGGRIGCGVIQIEK